MSELAKKARRAMTFSHDPAIAKVLGELADGVEELEGAASNITEGQALFGYPSPADVAKLRTLLDRDGAEL